MRPGLTLYLLAAAVCLVSSSENCLISESDYLFGEKNDEFLEHLLIPITKGHKKFTAQPTMYSNPAIQNAEKSMTRSTMAKTIITIIVKKPQTSLEVSEQTSPMEEVYTDQPLRVSPTLRTTFEPQRKFYNRFANGGLANIESLLSLIAGNFRQSSRCPTKSTPERDVVSYMEEAQPSASAIKKVIAKFSRVIKDASDIHNRLEKNADETERLEELQKKIDTLEQDARRISQRCKSEKSCLQSKKERYVFQLEGLKKVLRKQIELEKAVSRVLDEVQQTTAIDWESARLAKLRPLPLHQRRIVDVNKA